MYAQYCRLGLSVFASNYEVIRAALRLISPGGWRRDMRRYRHEYLRRMLGLHARAQMVYQQATAYKPY